MFLWIGMQIKDPMAWQVVGVQIAGIYTLEYTSRCSNLNIPATHRDSMDG